MSWLAQLVNPLNHVLFVFGADNVSTAELAGFVTGVASVWLTVNARISNFPVGIANNVFFLVLFMAARLYADSALQIVYVVLGLAGWWHWLHGGVNRSRLSVGRVGLVELLVLLALGAGATWGLTLLLGAAHDIAPFWDALTTAGSLVAQWLLNRKFVDSWFFWMFVDVIYIPLYFFKHLWLTGIVYILFLAMCVLGLRAWRAAWQPITAPALLPQPALDAAS